MVRGEGFFFFTIRNWITSKFTLTNSWWSIRCCFFFKHVLSQCDDDSLDVVYLGNHSIEASLRPVARMCW